MILFCGNCDKERFTITKEIKRGSDKGHVLTKLKCNNCGMEYPIFISK